MKNELEEWGNFFSSGDPLDRLAEIQSIVRKQWHIDNEPKHLKQNEYCRAKDIYTGEPVWNETDHSMRLRLAKQKQ